MNLIKNKNIFLQFFVFCFLLLFCSCQQQSNLIDLQKAYLFAQSDQEREEIINDLENYYLNLSVPDSISQRINQEVQAKLDTFKIDSSEYSEKILDEPNIYVLENKLRDLLELYMIAISREEKSMYPKFTAIIKRMAKRIDKETQFEYWVPFIDQIMCISKEKALYWLKTKKSYTLFLNAPLAISEFYVSLGLQYLAQTYDLRLRLDLFWELQYLLYEYYGFTDLAGAISKRELIIADSLNYHLRETGFNTHLATSLKRSGQIVHALNLFEKVARKAQEYPEIRDMNWQNKNALLEIAGVYWQFGQYDKALSICKKIEQLELTNKDKIRLYICRGLIYRNLGNYEIAEKEYNKALTIAEAENDNLNKIVILQNLGYMFYELTEYHKALEINAKASKILNQSLPNNYGERIDLLFDDAKVKVMQNKLDEVEELLIEANSLLERSGSLPSSKTELLNTIGKFTYEIGKHNDALNRFNEAEANYEKNGLLRKGLKVKIDIAKCLISLKRYSEAKEKLTELHSEAKKIDDIESVIDALALQAKVEEQKGNLGQAISISNRLIHEIKTISYRFYDTDRLISYRQKIHDYLKDAIHYEIQLKRIDSAFVKLDYAKSRSINRKQNRNIDSTKSGGIDINILKNNLKKGSLIINYMVTSDTLYAFVLDNEKLQLFKKTITIDTLRKYVNLYIETIKETVNIFNNYNNNKVLNHFETTTQLGHKLFQMLLDWPNLINRFKQIDQIYVISDEFLYALPFSTLVVEDSDTPTYLIHKASILNLPGLSFLQSKIKKENANQKDYSLLISADPSFPGMNEFVSKIKKIVQSTDVLTSASDIAESKDIINVLNLEYDVYLFSGHSVANTIDPDLSYIEVTVYHPFSSFYRTYQVNYSDLKYLQWSSPELVLLIGCETAGGKLYRGTGISGLQTRILSLGAQKVLASLWKINASEAIPHTQDFLNIYTHSFDAAQALRTIQLETLQSYYKDSYYQKPHPYFWGSYVLYSNSI